MALYNNDARDTRTGHEKGGSKGRQGGHGTGKVKSCADGNSGSPASFKPASEVVGEPIVGELEVPNSITIMKGASAVPSVALNKGSAGKPLGGGGKVKKPSDAEASGH